MTGPKEWTGLVSRFIDGEPESVWRKIYENQMSDESFTSGEPAAIESLLETNKFQTAFFTIEAMEYSSKPCELKFVWTSPEKYLASYAFPKGSPLLPFFKYAYSKIRQSGALQRINRKWAKNGESLNCDSNNSLEPITLKKVGSLIAVLIMGVLFAIVALIIEVCVDKMQEQKNKRSTSIEMKERTGT